MSDTENLRPTLQERARAIDLQCRWADALDRRDWQAVLACFSDDATADLPRTGRHSDPETMLRSIRSVVERLDATQHHLSNHLVNRGPEGLVVQCYVLAQHVRTIDGEAALFTFGGRYTDHLRDGERLTIVHRRLEVLWSAGASSILHP